VISEFPLGTPPLKENFPRRNRIISGLSLGVLVVEAAIASGSLITARTAGEQGREVFAIPGSIHSPFSKGCHALIKEGAKLVDCAEDILSELRWQPVIPRGARPAPQPASAAPALKPSLSPPPAGEDAAPIQALLTHMGAAPVAVDALAAHTGLAVAQVLSLLIQLELDGQVAAVAGGLYQRVRGNP
jgi:DNA processing protein